MLEQETTEAILIGQEEVHEDRRPDETEVSTLTSSSTAGEHSDMSSDWSPKETRSELLSQGPSSFECLFQRALEVLDFTPIDRQQSEDSESGKESSSLLGDRMSYSTGNGTEPDPDLIDEEVVLSEDEMPMEPEVRNDFDSLEERVGAWHSDGIDPYLL